jgi:hypothetical protein
MDKYNYMDYKTPLIKRFILFISKNNMGKDLKIKKWSSCITTRPYLQHQISKFNSFTPKNKK